MAKHEDKDEDRTGAAPLFALVGALYELAKTNAAHAALSPAASSWRALAACCASFLGDDEEAKRLGDVPTPSPYAYGAAPAFMPPGPEPTPGIPAAARDAAKQSRK